MSQTPPPVAVWEGEPSGEKFAALLRARAERLGVAVEVEVTPWRDPGGFGVTVNWGPESTMYEVADWVDGVRVLDTGDDVSVDEALDYLSARVSGLCPREAVQQVAPPPPSLWTRLRRRGR